MATAGAPQKAAGIRALRLAGKFKNLLFMKTPAPDGLKSNHDGLTLKYGVPSRNRMLVAQSQQTLGGLSEEPKIATASNVLRKRCSS
jgi:hypothetical protein